MCQRATGNVNSRTGVSPVWADKFTNARPLGLRLLFFFFFFFKFKWIKYSTKMRRFRFHTWNSQRNDGGMFGPVVYVFSIAYNINITRVQGCWWNRSGQIICLLANILSLVCCPVECLCFSGKKNINTPNWLRELYSSIRLILMCLVIARERLWL